MGFFDLFRSKSKSEKLSHLKMLVALAMIDGKIEDNELAALVAVCAREGIDEQEFQKLLNDPESVKFVVPKDEDKKMLYLKDMICMMMCDGEIHENEFVLCKMVAESLGYPHEVVDALVLRVINEIKSEMAK